MDPFKIIPPSKNKVPVVVSVPHCGTVIPSDVQPAYKPSLTTFIDDTDWYVDRLYDFVTEMGITMIHAVYSRWLIDLNRSPDNRPLYKDGRIITGLVPTTDFLGKGLYNENLPDEGEVIRRTQWYYTPYYEAVANILHDLKKQFGAVLLFDAHSIRQRVPTISEKKLPDLILGDNDGKSAADKFTQAALFQLNQSNYEVRHNFLFKGGHITRSFGNPKENVHALQLEMTKINYMDNTETSYHSERAERMKKTLRSTFEALIDII